MNNTEKCWSDLYERYPDLFKNKNKTIMESCMAWGCECGAGWCELINSVCYIIKEHEENKNYEKKEYIAVKFDQIKEKFGGLRIYFSGGDDYVEGVIRMAEEMSYKICEVCGNKGKPNKKGWIKTLCENCKSKSFEKIEQ